MPYAKAASPSTANLHRVFLLRTIAVTGQPAAVAFVAFYLDVRLPLAAIGTVITALAVFNLITWLRVGRASEPTHEEVLIQLLADVAALSGLLYLTGGRPIRSWCCSSSR